jgi:hypothetical protein
MMRVLADDESEFPMTDSLPDPRARRKGDAPFSPSAFSCRPDGGCRERGDERPTGPPPSLEARLRKAHFEQAPDGTLATDGEGRILYVNEQAAAMFGYSRPELLGQPVELLMPVRYRDRHGEHRQRYMTEVAIRQMSEARMVLARRKDDTEFPVCVSLVPLGPGAAPVVLAIVRDMTRLWQAEERLRHTQKMEAVGRLAGGIAHDFNNLLTVIIGYAAMVLDGPDLAGSCRQQVQEIARAGQRAADLIRKLLAFSRRQTLLPRVLDLNALLTSLADMLRPVLGRGIELALELSLALDPVEADPGQLEQVVMNLVFNARDAMPDGGRLTLETSNQFLTGAPSGGPPEARPGRYVMFAVRDTGCGMDQAVLAHLFEPYFTTKEVGKGTGLGLATVHGLIKQSNGFINVASEPGRGTTVRVYLPSAEARSPNLPRPVPEVPAVAGGSETILLVESQEAVRRVLGSILRLHGYQVVSASSGPEALNLAEQHPGPIDLAIVAVLVPEISSRALVARLAADQPRLKVLLLSGGLDDGPPDCGLPEGMVDYLQKPIGGRVLIPKVRKLLDRGGPA